MVDGDAEGVRHLVELLTLGIAVYERCDAVSRRDGKLTLARAGVLGAMTTAEEVTFTELAERLHRARHSLTPIVDDLEAQGLLSRRRDSLDRRFYPRAIR